MWRYESYWFAPSYRQKTLRPYYIPVQNKNTFEVIIKDNLTGITYSEYQDILNRNDSELQTDVQTDIKSDIEKQDVKEETENNISVGKSRFNKICCSYIFSLILMIA